MIKMDETMFVKMLAGNKLFILDFQFFFFHKKFKFILVFCHIHLKLISLILFLVCGSILTAVFVVKFFDGTVYPIEW